MWGCSRASYNLRTHFSSSTADIHHFSLTAGYISGHRGHIVTADEALMMQINRKLESRYKHEGGSEFGFRLQLLDVLSIFFKKWGKKTTKWNNTYLFTIEVWIICWNKRMATCSVQKNALIRLQSIRQGGKKSICCQWNSIQILFRFPAMTKHLLRAEMLLSRHLSDPLLLSQNSDCDAIEQQYHSMDGSIHPWIF